MTNSNIPNVLIVARMSPEFNTSTRHIIRVLRKICNIKVIAESQNGKKIFSKIIDDAQVIELPLPFGNKHFLYLTGIIRVIYFNLFAINEILRNKYSVVICSDSIYIFAGIIAKRINRCTFVYHSHEIMWGLGNPRILSLFLGWLEKIAIEICDFWIVHSESRAHLISERHHSTKRYIVFENFPIEYCTQTNSNSLNNPRLYKHNVPQNIPIVIFQGSITRKRGLSELIESAQSGDFHVVIQGDGNLLPILKKVHHENVTFINACPNEEIMSWVKTADYSFIYYENDCINSAYACSNKFYTSVFAGIPIICNRLPSFQIFSDEFGGVAFFEELTAGAIKDCVCDLINHPVRHKKLKMDLLLAKEVLRQRNQENNLYKEFLTIFTKG